MYTTVGLNGLPLQVNLPSNQLNDAITQFKLNENITELQHKNLNKVTKSSTYTNKSKSTVAKLQPGLGVFYTHLYFVIKTAIQHIIRY